MLKKVKIDTDILFTKADVREMIKKKYNIIVPANFDFRIDGGDKLEVWWVHGD